MTEIRGKAAVVTGGGSGIGMGLAKALAKRGASVAIADIIPENARKIVDEINAAGGKAVAIDCDVCERAALAEMKSRANAALGPIGLVFANAGATAFHPLMEMSEDDVDWIAQVNFMAVVNTVRAFLPEMMAAKEGHLVATSSMSGLVPVLIPAHTMYSATKLGVIGFMMNLALEMRPYNIYTTSYCPGGVATNIGAHNERYRPARFGGPREAGVHLPPGSGSDAMQYFSPEDVAPMVMRAVETNRPFVFDHADQRHLFGELYADVVEAGYDDLEAYEREHGRPQDVGRAPVARHGAG
jgi:NAD(P)-dependent dehydrogenase (short-subunit alcohol dehydrogenase family)